MGQTSEHPLPVGRFSISTLNWVRMPTIDGVSSALPPVFTLDEILDGIVAAGFRGVGLDDITLGALDAATVGAALHHRGLTCSEIGILRAGGSRETAAAAERLAQLAQATGATCCIAIVGDPPPRDPLAALKVAADILDGAGVRLALEFAAYGSLATLAGAIEFCDAVGWERCGLLLDSWHVLHAESPWALLESVDGSQVALVHLNDAPHVPGSDPVHDSRFRREPPGEGSLDLVRFLDVLAGIGYRGAVSLEVLSSRVAATPPAPAARDLMAALVTAGFVQAEPPVISARCCRVGRAAGNEFP